MFAFCGGKCLSFQSWKGLFALEVRILGRRKENVAYKQFLQLKLHYGRTLSTARRFFNVGKSTQTVYYFSLFFLPSSGPYQVHFFAIQTLFFACIKNSCNSWKKLKEKCRCCFFLFYQFSYLSGNGGISLIESLTSSSFFNNIEKAHRMNFLSAFSISQIRKKCIENKRKYFFDELWLFFSQVKYWQGTRCWWMFLEVIRTVCSQLFAWEVNCILLQFSRWNCGTHQVRGRANELGKIEILWNEKFFFLKVVEKVKFCVIL